MHVNFKINIIISTVAFFLYAISIVSNSSDYIIVALKRTSKMFSSKYFILKQFKNVL